MPDAHMAPAIRESRQDEFSHGQQELCTLVFSRKCGTFERARASSDCAIVNGAA
jgi:hypothetical protein